MRNSNVNMYDARREGANSPITPRTDEPELENTTCPAVGYHSFSICAPVEVRPFAEAGETITKCCGAATITPGDYSCPGEVNGSCFFTISQKICVEVPIVFGATTIVGDAAVECLQSSDTDICYDCE